MKFVDIILLGVGQIGARLEGCCKCEAGGRKKEGGKMKKILQLRHLPHSHSSLPQLHSFSSCHPDQKHPHHHVSSSSASAGLRETLCNEVQTRGCHVIRKSRGREKELDRRRRGHPHVFPPHRPLPAYWRLSNPALVRGHKPVSASNSSSFNSASHFSCLLGTDTLPVSDRRQIHC